MLWLSIIFLFIALVKEGNKNVRGDHLRKARLTACRRTVLISRKRFEAYREGGSEMKRGGDGERERGREETLGDRKEGVRRMNIQARVPSCDV